MVKEVKNAIQEAQNSRNRLESLTPEQIRSQNPTYGISLVELLGTAKSNRLHKELHAKPEVVFFPSPKTKLTEMELCEMYLVLQDYLVEDENQTCIKKPVTKMMKMNLKKFKRIFCETLASYEKHEFVRDL